jgi:hypothetical protein
LLAQPVGADERSALDEAVDVLRQILGAGSVLADEARDQARKAGVSDRTLDRAKARLGVRAEREGFGKDGTWHWALGAGKDKQGPAGGHRAPEDTIERQATGLAPNGDSGPLWPEALEPDGVDGEAQALSPAASESPGAGRELWIVP